MGFAARLRSRGLVAGISYIGQPDLGFTTPSSLNYSVPILITTALYKSNLSLVH